MIDTKNRDATYFFKEMLNYLTEDLEWIQNVSTGYLTFVNVMYN